MLGVKGRQTSSKEGLKLPYFTPSATSSKFLQMKADKVWFTNVKKCTKENGGKVWSDFIKVNMSTFADDELVMVTVIFYATLYKNQMPPIIAFFDFIFFSFCCYFYSDVMLFFYSDIEKCTCFMQQNCLTKLTSHTFY